MFWLVLALSALLPPRFPISHGVLWTVLSHVRRAAQGHPEGLKACWGTDFQSGDECGVGLCAIELPVVTQKQRPPPYASASEVYVNPVASTSYCRVVPHRFISPVRRCGYTCRVSHVKGVKRVESRLFTVLRSTSLKRTSVTLYTRY